MGDYTPSQKLYKVDADELVSAEQGLNYNWRRLDDSMKGLMEWIPVEGSSISGAVRGHKYLKRQSNSTWIADSNGIPKQDLNAYVNTWLLIPESSYAPGWGQHSDPKFGRPMYYVDSSGEVFLRGTMQKTDFSEIPVKTNTTIITALPVAARPTQSRYFFQHQGLADSLGYSVNRFFVNSDGLFQMIRYGNTQGNPLERYLTFSGLSYLKDVS